MGEDARKATEVAPTWTRGWGRICEAACPREDEKYITEAVVARAKIVEIEPSGEGAEAASDFVRHVQRPNEKDAHQFKVQGNAAYRAKEWSKALSLYSIGIGRLDVQEPAHLKLRSDLCSCRASAFVALRDWGAAAGDAHRAVQANPGSARARCLLGVACLGMRQTEDAYAAFAEAVKKDHEYSEARRGRDMCLVQMAHGLSSRMEARKQWRLHDAERPKASTRVFCMSDIHLDHSQRQWSWVMNIEPNKFKEDVLIVAGNLAIKMPSILGGLQMLKSKFRRVFYTVGNDEMRIVGHDFPDSIAHDPQQASCLWPQPLPPLGRPR